MWQALRAELTYSRPYLIGGFGIALGVLVIVSVVFALVGEEGPPAFAAEGIRGMFLVLAPMIVGFIAQSFRSEEKRFRLLLSGPITPRDIAGSIVLLPAILLGIGVLIAGMAIAVESLITGTFDAETLNIIGFVAGQLFVYTQIGLLIQEAAAARGQRRVRDSILGWTALAVAVVLLATLYMVLAQELVTWFHMILGHLIIAIAAATATVKLFQGRTDFTS